MQVLVTGGAGFIGSHLVERLIDLGYSVTILDDLSTGNLTNLERVISNPKLRFVEGSVTDELMVDPLVKEADVVIHLAAAVGVKLVMDQTLRSFQTNVRGTEVVVEAACRTNTKVLLASTSEVYGKNSSGIFSEDSDFVYGPTSVARWTYALSKAADEVLAHYYCKEFGLPTVIFRLFNTVGPRQSGDFGMVLPRLVKQALTGIPLTVFGDGSQRHCFCHVDDTVAAILSMLDSSACVGEAFNVGAITEISIIDAARMIVEMTSSTSPIVLVPYEEAYGPGFEDIPRRVPNISKLASFTGWTPTKTLEDVMHSVVDCVLADMMA